MYTGELTGAQPLATSTGMTDPILPDAQQRGGPNGRRGLRVVLAGMMASAVAGCISVSAPDKPIVIELNINIKHDVLVQLSGDAKQTVQDHKDIF